MSALVGTATSLCEACDKEAAGGRYCSDRCRCWARLHPGMKRATGRRCEFCRVDIDHKAASARYCTKACREKAVGERRIAPVEVRTCGVCLVAFHPRREDQAGCTAKHGRILYDREYHAVRRQARKSSPVKFKRSDLALRLSMFAGCWVCGGPKEQVDHVKPLAKGGLHILANLRPICAPCNRRKWAQWPWSP